MMDDLFEDDRPVRPRHGLLYRAAALGLSWIFTATTVWAAAPPRVSEPGVVYTRPLRSPAAPFRPYRARSAETMPRAETRPTAWTPSESAEVEEASPEPTPAPEPQAGGGGGSPASMSIFGPQRYVRTTGPKNEYTTQVSVPAWVVSPFRMTIQNGEPDGTCRVSSATVEVNGTAVAVPSDFNQNVASLERMVTLTPQTTLHIVLASKPCSFLIINLFGVNADHTPPQIAVAEPVPGSIINDSTPRLRVTYRDVAGSGEPAASHVDAGSLRVELDGVDRTSLFTKRCDEATAQLPDSLALAAGLHHIRATIRDRAGNTGEANADFRVDLAPPTVQVTTSPAGAFLPTRTPQIRVAYQDDVGVAVSTLRITINGVDRTALFQKGPTEAVAVLNDSSALPEGPNLVSAAIRDVAGNLGSGAASFRVDVRPPQLIIRQPPNGSRHGSNQVEAIVEYGDDQGLELGTFAATVDQSPAALSTGPEGASGILGPLADGAHRLTVRIRDRAGNESIATSDFTVDTGIPDIRVIQPPPGVNLNTGTPQVLVGYSDPQGVNTATFRVTFETPNGNYDATALFTVGAASATATVPAAQPLPEGMNTIRAEIRDLTGNLGSHASTFRVDTIAPQAALVAPVPGAKIAEARPVIRFTFSDENGSGIDLASVRVRIDGQDRTALFVVSASSAQGQPDVALAEGDHVVELTVQDLAGNPTVVSGGFTVDTLRPTAVFVSPADNSFLNDSTPALRITYGDGTGTGVVPASVHVFHRKGDDPETEITSYFQVGAGEATGVVPDAAALTDGTHHLRVTLEDQAGNAGEAASSFEIDTVAPTYQIELPARDDVIPTARPAILVLYQDDRQVDTARFVFKIDGVDLTSRLQVRADRAEGVLAAADALAEGSHRVEVTVVDRAGNAAPATEHLFTVDTLAPVASVEQPPNGAYLATDRPLVRFQYHDVGDRPSGIDPGSVRIQIDGADRTAEFTIGATSAEATLSTPLGDGAHFVHIDVYDRADNHGEARSDFVIDTQPPVLTVTSPAEGALLGPENGAAQVTVVGTVEDRDPETRVECRTSSPVAAVVNGTEFRCTVPLLEGDNAITVVATDRGPRSTTVVRNVVFDGTPPVVTILEPTAGQFVFGASVDVRGTVADAHPGTVEVEGIQAAVNGNSFVATGVPIGEGPDVTLHARATDRAGNVGPPASVTVHVDRQPPVVHITQPTNGQYLRGPNVEVKGTVADVSPTTVEVNGQPVMPPGVSPFTILVPATEGPFTITAIARDAANNTGRDEVNVIVDSIAPVITVTAPAEGTPTRELRTHLVGTVQDASPVSLTVDGATVPLVNGGFDVEVNLPSEGINRFLLVATDAAGNSSQREVPVLVDRTPPALEVVSPAEGAVIAALPLFVQGTVHDASPVTVKVGDVSATVVQNGWQAVIPVVPEGPYTFTVTARDAAGNQTTVTRTVIVDLTSPVVVIETPSEGTLTRASAIDVSGTVVSGTSVSVTVNGAAAIVSGGSPFHFSAAGVPLVEGLNLITATAVNQSGRPGSASVHVTRDSIPPLVDLAAPETISRSRAAEAVASASDDGSGIAEVVIKVNGVVLATFSQPPYRVDLVVPPTASAGDTLTVTAEARDRAGNTATASRGVRVASDGVVVGQVLSDQTSLPLPGALVQVVGGSAAGVEVTTDERGRYSMPARDPELVLAVRKDGMTGVDREVTVSSGVGTVPLDARLTPLADATRVGADGATLTVTGPPRVDVTLPAGALAQDTGLRLTGLSAQGLPGLLPLGWSPVAAFDLRGEVPGVTLSLPPSLSVTGVPEGSVHLVSYRSATHGWYMVTPELAVTSGAVSAGLPGLGAYALVTADVVDPPIAVPPAGEILTGLEVVSLPVTASSSGAVAPPVLPPTGGTARGTLTVLSPITLPSGTAVQAEVTETFTLANGDVASEEKRLEDLLIFRLPVPAGSDTPSTSSSRLHATFPIQASRSFQTTELTQGKVHLDILAGRESVRGRTGGNEPVALEAGDVRLLVPAHALGSDTALAVESVTLSPFLPSTAGLVPIAEAVLDFSGQTLGLAAELQITTAAVSPADTLLIARVERDFTEGIPRLVVVAGATLVGDRAVSTPIPGLPGLTREGRYVLYRTPPVGTIAGTVSSSAGPIKALLQAEGLPFVAISGLNGHYVLVAPGGRVTVSALVPRTSLRGSAPADVTVGQTTALDVLLAGTVSTAQVAPADGSLGVDPNIQIEITTSLALNPATVTTSNVRLLAVDGGAVVPLRLVLAGSGKLLAVVPQARLAFSAAYRLEAGGLADVFGGLVSVPTTTFTTKADVPPVYNTKALVVSMPDANGNVTVTAPPGSLPPGTTVLIINFGNGFVATFTAENDGAVGRLVPADLPASISDQLLITITDPLGNVTSFTRSQYVDAATGKTAVGAGGGTVEAIDGSGVELRIPEGALDKGVTLKIEGVTAEQLETLFPGQKPDIPEAHVGSALKITSEDTPTFKKEVKVAFPLPDFTTVPASERPSKPTDAFYYVYRRLQGPCPNGAATCADGERPVVFETIDQAFFACPDGKTECPDAEKRVVTASPPFSGLVSSYGAFAAGGAVGALAATFIFLMWSFEELLPGRPLPGVITGRVIRRTDTGGFVSAPGVMVSGVDGAGNPLLSGNKPVAISQADGTYTLWDALFTGGSVALTATDPVTGATKTVTALEVNPLDTKSPALGLYRNVATANITFDPVAPPPPAPDLEIHVMRQVNGSRRDTNGLVVVGEMVIVGLKNNRKDAQFTINGALVGGEERSVAGPLSNEPSGFDFLVDGGFTAPRPGVFSIEVTALLPFGPPVTGRYTLRAIAAGGSNNDNLPNDPPAIVTAQTLPKDGARGVPVDAFIQIVFTEPVTNVYSATVELRDEFGERVELSLSGVGPDGPVENLDATPTAKITSLTVQPLGLKFGTKYTLTLADGIQDLDKDAQGAAAPKNLAFSSTSFTTFGPEFVGESDEKTGSPGIVVLGNRAYLARTNYFVNGNLEGYKLEDPAKPEKLRAEGFFAPRPTDLVGLDTGAARLVAVAVGPTNRPKPSSVVIFDVTNDSAFPRLGAASVTSNIMEGYISRLAIKGGFVYAAVSRPGGTRAGGLGTRVGVIDIEQARAAMAGATEFQVNKGLNTDGEGFGQGAVVQQIEVTDANGKAWRAMYDLKAGDYVADGAARTLVVAVGMTDLPEFAGYLAVVDPLQGSVLATLKLATTDGFYNISFPSAVALGRVGNMDLAVVTGSGSRPNGSGAILMVVDLTDPAAPRVVSALGVSASLDVIVKDNVAFLGGSDFIEIVNLTDPADPTPAGTIKGAGGRLAMGDNGILYSTALNRFGGNDPLGGVRTTTLRRLLILSVASTPSPILFDGDLRTIDPVNLSYRIVPGSEPAKELVVKVLRRDIVVDTPAAFFDGVQGSSVWPAGSAVQPTQPYYAQATADAGTPDELVSVRVPIPISDVTVEFDKERQAFVAHAADGQTLIENTWSSTGIEPPINKWDFKTSTRTFTKAVSTSNLQPPRRPSDYMILKINSGGALVWDEVGGEIMRVDVPDDGKIEAKLRATKDLAFMSIERILITVQYFPDSSTRTPLKLKDDFVYISNERLHGRLFDFAAAAVGRGDETVEAKVTELTIGLIPFAGDIAGIIGEIINAVDPETEVSKINLVLSIVGFGTEFLDPTIIGAGLDKGIVILRIGLKELTKVAGPLRRMPGEIWDLIKARRFAEVAEHTGGSIKMARVGGGSFAARVVREEGDKAVVNRFLKRYSKDLADETFVQKLLRFDEVYANPDAVRGAVRALSEFKDAAGEVIRLSDEAVEGAVKFMAKAGNSLSAAEKEELLKLVLTNQDEAEALLKYVRRSTDPKAVEGFTKMLNKVTCPVP